MAKALIVDETELFLKLGHTYLRRSGFDLDEISHSRTRRRKAGGFQSDFVLLMPEDAALPLEIRFDSAHGPERIRGCGRAVLRVEEDSHRVSGCACRLAELESRARKGRQAWLAAATRVR